MKMSEQGEKGAIANCNHKKIKPCASKLSISICQIQPEGQEFAIPAYCGL